MKFSFKNWLCLFTLLMASFSYGQNPQNQTAPISEINAKYVNGVAPGYIPKMGTGLTLNVGPGTTFCNGSVVQYYGGSLTMAASSTNYIYLNSAANCVPAVKATAFTALDIPIATILTSGTSITGVTDLRSQFVTPSNQVPVNQRDVVAAFTGAVNGSNAALNASAMTTDHATGSSLTVPGPLNATNAPSYTSTAFPLSTTGGTGIITANFGTYQYVSVQGSSTIQIYDTSTGVVKSVGYYTTSCTNPGGIAFANAGTSVIGAYTCGTSLYPVTVNPMTGALSTLASSTVTIPQSSWPGMISDGTNFYIPTGGNCPATSIVYKYSAATLSLVGQYQLANSSDGTQQCSAYMAYSGGNLYLVAGGEPTTSTIQVVDAATMTEIGSPLVVAHSPQRIVAQGTYLYVAYYDAAKVDIINAANPLALSIVSSISLPSASVTLAVQGTRLYVGLYASGGTIAAYDVSNPALPLFLQNLPTSVPSPQDLKINGRWLMAVSNSTNGNLVAFDTGGAGITYLNATEIYAPTITSSKISGTAGFFAGMTASNVNAGTVGTPLLHSFSHQQAEPLTGNQLFQPAWVLNNITSLSGDGTTLLQSNSVQNSQYVGHGGIFMGYPQAMTTGGIQTNNLDSMTHYLQSNTDGQVGGQLSVATVHFGHGDGVNSYRSSTCTGNTAGYGEGCELDRAFIDFNGAVFGLQPQSITVNPTTGEAALQSALSGDGYSPLAIPNHSFRAEPENAILIDTTNGRQYTAGNVQSISTCVPGTLPTEYIGNAVCLTGDSASEWSATYGTSTVTYVTGQINRGSSANPTNQFANGPVAVDLQVASVAGFSVGQAITISDDEDLFENPVIESINTGANTLHVWLTKPHAVGDLVTAGGAVGHALSFNADDYAQGTWPGQFVNGAPYRLALPILASLPGNILVFNTQGFNQGHLWGTKAYESTQITAMPTAGLTLTGGVVTAINMATYGNSAAVLPANTAYAGGVGSNPLPTIQWSAACTVQPTASVSYTNEGGAYNVNLLTGGSGCPSGLGITIVPSTITNPYTIWPYVFVVDNRNPNWHGNCQGKTAPDATCDYRNPEVQTDQNQVMTASTSGYAVAQSVPSTIAVGDLLESVYNMHQSMLSQYNFYREVYDNGTTGPVVQFKFRGLKTGDAMSALLNIGDPKDYYGTSANGWRDAKFWSFAANAPDGQVVSGPVSNSLVLSVPPLFHGYDSNLGYNGSVIHITCSDPYNDHPCTQGYDQPHALLDYQGGNGIPYQQLIFDPNTGIWSQRYGRSGAYGFNVHLLNPDNWITFNINAGFPNNQVRFGYAGGDNEWGIYSTNNGATSVGEANLVAGNHLDIEGQAIINFDSGNVTNPSQPQTLLSQIHGYTDGVQILDHTGGLNSTMQVSGFKISAPSTSGSVVTTNLYSITTTDINSNIKWHLPEGSTINGNLFCDSAGNNCPAITGMVYPAAGVPVSTGTAWAASLAAPSGAIVGTTDTQTLTNKTFASTILAQQGINFWTAASPMTINSDGSYFFVNGPTQFKNGIYVFDPSGVGALATSCSGTACSFSGVNGVTSIFTNGGVSWNFSGAVNGAAGFFGNLTGNADTATALAATPSLCGSGFAPQGILANGNATGCTAITSGGGMVYPGAGIAVSTGSAWGISLTAPAGAIVGTTDTQTLTNKTVDGVSPTTMGYLDATSSVQTQLNGKQATGNYLTGLTGDCTASGPGSAAINCTKSGGVAFGSAAFTASSAYLPSSTVVPGNQIAVAHKFFSSYSSGVFGAVQPDFSDLTGQATNAQIANPSTSVNGVTCTLGSTCTITAVAAVNPYQSITSASGALTVTFTSSNTKQHLVLVQGDLTTITLAGMVNGGTYILELEEPATGTGNVAWGNSSPAIRWQGGSPPTLSTVSSKIDLITITFDDSGNILAAASLGY